jgi:DNA modification methylase
MLLPLLEAMRDAGGTARPTDIYHEVAERIGLSTEERDAQITSGKKTQSHFQRTLRWLRQSEVKKGTIASGGRGKWVLTDEGAAKLLNAQPGVLITIFETTLGKAIWGRAEHVIGQIQPETIDLIFSSPPYPNANKEYESGMDLTAESWVDWMFDLITALGPKTTKTGSMMLNIAETYLAGTPIKSEHISRLRIRLADETKFRVLDTLYWNNTSRLPSPFTFVAQQRIRLKPSVEPILWISENPQAEADNRRILNQYGQSMKDNLSGLRPYQQVTRHPSGHRFSSRGFAKDNGGSIAAHIIECGAAGGNRAYYEGARSENLPIHPAIMPQRVAEFGIGLATKINGMVADPLAGSLTTAAAAEAMGRRWLCSDVSLAYLAGGRHRFSHRTEHLNLTA